MLKQVGNRLGFVQRRLYHRVCDYDDWASDVVQLEIPTIKPSIAYAPAGVFIDDKTGKIIGECAPTLESCIDRVKPSPLAQDAIRAAFKDYEAKKANFSDNSENAADAK